MKKFLLFTLFASAFLGSCTNELDETSEVSASIETRVGSSYDFLKITEHLDSKIPTGTINAALADMCTEKEYSYLYELDKDNEYKFSDVLIDPTISEEATAVYNVETRVFKFYDVSAINALTLTEEFLHMNQHYCYDGLGKYWEKGMSNIEFEAKFVQDVINYRGFMPTQFLSQGKDHLSDFLSWMDTFAESNDFPDFSQVESGINGCNWWDFIEDFRQENINIRPYAVKVDGSLTGKLVDLIGSKN